MRRFVATACVPAARAEDPVNIPDPAFKAAIEQALGVTNLKPNQMPA